MECMQELLCKHSRLVDQRMRAQASYHRAQRHVKLMKSRLKPTSSREAYDAAVAKVERCRLEMKRLAIRSQALVDELFEMGFEGPNVVCPMGSIGKCKHCGSTREMVQTYWAPRRGKPEHEHTFVVVDGPEQLKAMDLGLSVLRPDWVMKEMSISNN